MIALKTLRHDLATHLANAVGSKAAKLGAQINPPTVLVQPAAEYLSPLPGYCIDGIGFEAVLITKPGDPAAEMDALDDMVDQVRARLRTASPAGHHYQFVGVTGRATYAAGEKDFPAVVVTARYERDNDA